jgi:hypothetical protein
LHGGHRSRSSNGWHTGTYLLSCTPERLQKEVKDANPWLEILCRRAKNYGCRVLESASFKRKAVPINAAGAVGAPISNVRTMGIAALDPSYDAVSQCHPEAIAEGSRFVVVGENVRFFAALRMTFVQFC